MHCVRCDCGRDAEAGAAVYHCDASGRVPHPRGAEAFEITPPYMLLIISPYTAHYMGDRNLFSLSHTHTDTHTHASP